MPEPERYDSGSGSSSGGSKGSAPASTRSWLLLVDAQQELGSGRCGTVWGGTLDGEPVAAKSVSLADSSVLQHEAHLYQTTLRHLQTGYCLLLSRVWGRQLTRKDGHLFDEAAQALCAVHAAGVLHGDVRLPNFLVEEEPSEGGAPKVFVIDFENSRVGCTEEEMEDELEQLWSVFEPTEEPASPEGFPPALTGRNAGCRRGSIAAQAGSGNHSNYDISGSSSSGNSAHTHLGVGMRRPLSGSAVSSATGSPCPLPDYQQVHTPLRPRVLAPRPCPAMRVRGCSRVAMPGHSSSKNLRVAGGRSRMVR